MKKRLIPILALSSLTLAGCSLLDNFKLFGSASSSEESSIDPAGSEQSSERPDISYDEPDVFVMATFYDYDGSILQSTQIKKGTSVVYTGKTPSRPDGEKYKYTFSKWDKSLDRLTDATEFYPVFRSSAQKFNARFYGGTKLLYQTTVEFGEKTTFPYDTWYILSNTFNDDEEARRHSFVGWDKDPSTYCLTEDLDFHAQFTDVGQQLNYSEIWVQDDDGTSIYGYQVVNTWTQSATVTIPETYNGRPVLSIGPWAFNNNQYLERVYCPSSLRSIQPYAFRGCSLLNSIQFQEGLVSIGDHAFAQCPLLEVAIFKNGLQNIDYEAFSDSGLTSISLPKTVTWLGERAFANCPNLVKVDLSKTEAPLSSGLFNNDPALTEVIFNPAVTRIPSRLFENCPQLKNVQLPRDLTVIEDSAFINCNSLKDLTIPKKTKTIQSNAFNGCQGLTNVIVEGDALREIGGYAFGSTNLSYLELGDGVESIYWGILNSTPLYNDETNRDGSIYYLRSRSGDSAYIYRSEEGNFASISPKTKVVAEGVYFSQKSVFIPEALCQDLTFLRGRSFYGVILEDESKYREIDGAIYEGKTLFSFYDRSQITYSTPEFVETIGEQAFAQDLNLKTIYLSEGVKTVGRNAFYSDSISIVAVPTTIESIDSAFSGFDRAKLLFPVGVTPRFAGDNEPDMTRVYTDWTGELGEENGAQYFLAKDKGAVVYDITPEDANWNTYVQRIVVPAVVGGQEVYEIANCCRPDFNWDMNIEIQLPDSIRRIGRYFCSQENSSSRYYRMNLPKSIEEIDMYGFRTRESSVVIPSTVQKIRYYGVILNNGGTVYLERADYPEDGSISMDSFPSYGYGVTVAFYSDSPIYDGRHWHYTGNNVPTMYVA